MAERDLSEFFGDVPGAPGEISWGKLKRGLGIDFPSDYRAFCEKYPALEINSYLVLMHPCSRVVGVGYPEAADGILQVFRESRETRPRAHPHLFFPEVGGLLPWGFDKGGAFLFWKTSGKSEEWDVVVFDGGTYYEYEMSFSEFIGGFLDGSVDCPGLPGDLAAADISVAVVE